jgi:leucyl-tRNA synthetase
MAKYYHPQEIEKKWQKGWEKARLYRTPNRSSRRKLYILDMFPYPSGAGLHVGHTRIYTASDVLARFFRMKGYNVLHPMGWDAFGLPAENDAIRRKTNPNKLVPENIANFKRQMKMLGFSYDWNREINTSSPDYYRWTQWLFLKMYKAGLVYQKEVPIWWCPFCKTGLANEEVLPGGIHERCGKGVERRQMKQWLFKITDYAEKLLDLGNLDWPEGILEMQKNWIGRSEGINIEYEIEGSREKITCFTTRPDTNFGATFIVLAPEHPLALKVTKPKYQQTVSKYIRASLKRTELERIADGRKKTGVFTGNYCVNNLNGKKMPIWISDFVIYTVGTGAVVGVPGHDRRDFEFAQEFDLPVIRVVVGPDGDTLPITRIEQVQEEKGTMVNSEFLNGLDIHEATQKIMDFLEEKGWGKRTITYKLRDWVFSRQRYWGEPMPLIHCKKCGIMPVPENELPVELPFVESYEPTGTGESPLAAISEWVETRCPKCGGEARRETDTMPNWAGSCWYFLRFVDPENRKAPFSNRLIDYWLPVDWYLGGAEHAVLHLLYARFWVKVFHDLGLLSFSEPFYRLRNVGMVLAPDGRKMSKSLGNVINPDDVVKNFGSDTLRVYEMFMGPFDQTINWSTQGVNGAFRFLNRVWRIYSDGKIKEDKENLEVTRALHRLIKKVSEDIEDIKFNTAIAAFMEFVNLLYKQKSIGRRTLEALVLLLSPFTPHLCEELWFTLNPKPYTLDPDYSVHKQPWPKFDPKLAVEEKVTIVIQVNGKLRDKIEVESGTSKDKVLKLAKVSPKTQKHLSGKKIKKTIFVENRLINFVVW